MVAHLQVPSQEGLTELLHTLSRNLSLRQEPLHVRVTVVDAHSWEVLRLEAEVAQGPGVGLYCSVDQHKQELEDRDMFDLINQVESLCSIWFVAHKAS